MGTREVRGLGVQLENILQSDEVAPDWRRGSQPKRREKLCDQEC